MAKRKTRSKGYCFTINNYDDEAMCAMGAIYEEIDDCSYLICGFEKGKTGTEHIQGYVHFTNARTFATVRKIFKYYNVKPHIEAQKASTNVAAYCYCMEDGKYVEYGQRPRQGHRTDLEVIKHDLMNGRPMKEISHAYFSQWCQYRRAFDEFKKLHTKYETKLYAYDSKSHQAWREVYSEYNPERDLLLTDPYHIFGSDILAKYYSGQYAQLYVPLSFVDDTIKEIVFDYIR